MTTPIRFAAPAIAFLLSAATAIAQTSTPSSDQATRPATTTFDGDTGLWYVPTAEVLARGAFSASAFRAGFNYLEGFSNVSDIAGTFGYGVHNGIELFTSFKFDTRIDRDIRPLFIANPTVGGVNPRYPKVSRGWSGDNVGDWTVGIKINFMNEEQQKPVAIALRGMVKIPTGDDEAGVSTGKADALVDFVVSKDVQRMIELAAYGGAAFRGSTDGVSQSNGLRWGVGAGFPSHSPLRVTGELHGEQPFDDTVTLSSPFVAIDGSLAPTTTDRPNFTAATAGLTWQHRRGFFLGAGLTLNLPSESRDGFVTDEDESGDFVDYQFRFGYRPRRPQVRAAASRGAHTDADADPGPGKPASNRDRTMRTVHGGRPAEPRPSPPMRATPTATP